jgi:hypothetical protein
MKVYQLLRCEEYFMQEDHGIFTSPERAKKEIGILYPNEKILLEESNDEGIIIVTASPNDHAKPDTTRVVARDGKVVTKENLALYMRSFEFYDITHVGYEVWGIYPVEVKE